MALTGGVWEGERGLPAFPERACLREKGRLGPARRTPSPSFQGFGIFFFLVKSGLQSFCKSADFFLVSFF